MTIGKTRDFYRNFNNICDCSYCRNYIKEVRKTYPDLAEYLNKIGVDIEKPFETMPGEPDGGYIEYFGIQYIIIDDKNNFKKEKCGEVRVDLAKSFPDPGIDGEYYVIEIYPIKLKWRKNTKNDKNLQRIYRSKRRIC